MAKGLRSQIPLTPALSQRRGGIIVRQPANPARVEWSKANLRCPLSLWERAGVRGIWIERNIVEILSAVPNRFHPTKASSSYRPPKPFSFSLGFLLWWNCPSQSPPPHKKSAATIDKGFITFRIHFLLPEAAGHRMR